MLRRLVAPFVFGLLAVAVAYAQQANAAKPDTLLVLKNGAEVRGVFVELTDDQYTLRLPDGRLMSYPAAEVARMERLAGSESRTPTTTPQQSSTVDPASCRTFISEKDVDKAFYTAIKDIKASKRWYGSTAEMYGDLAERARTVGADAVINVRTWHSPSGFAWAAPHAGGMAVKWTEAGRKALPTLEGRCY